MSSLDSAGVGVIGHAVQNGMQKNEGIISYHANIWLHVCMQYLSLQHQIRTTTRIHTNALGVHYKL